MKSTRLTLLTFILGMTTLIVDGRVGTWLEANPQIVGTIEQVRLFDRPESADRYPEVEPVTIAAFGDMMLGRYVWTLMERNGHDYPFEYFPELLEHMMKYSPEDAPTAVVETSTTEVSEETQIENSPDFLFANLEGPISDNPYRNPGTAMRFNFKPAVIETLEKYGFNLLSIANNHTFDMGDDGELQTRQYLTEAGIHHFGHSKEVREESRWITTVDSTTLAFIGLNDTVYDDLDYEAARTLIAETEDQVDFTIVSIHWGVEYATTPSFEQIENAHAFVEAGADVILGHHPHVITYPSTEAYADRTPDPEHGTVIAEWFDGPDGEPRPIYYSLGNFIFDQYFQADVQEGLGLTITLQKSLNPNEPDTIAIKETVFDLLVSQPQIRD